MLAAGGTLIGQVIDVRPHTAFVRLITDPDSAVRVLHQPSRSEVVATGDTLGNIEVRIPWTSEVELGHLFVTSGLDGELPQGIPVGRVSAAEGTGPRTHSDMSCSNRSRRSINWNRCWFSSPFRRPICKSSTPRMRTARGDRA